MGLGWFFHVGVIVSYVEPKRGGGDAFFSEAFACETKKRQPCSCRDGRFAWLELLVCFMEREWIAALVAAAAVRGHRLGDRVADPAGGGGVPEGGDLGCFDALGKFGGLRFGGAWT